MSNYAVIENNLVTNVYVAEAPLDPNDVLVTNQGIGWSYVNGEFIAPPAPIPTPIPLPAQAQSVLTKTDTTVLRCYSAGVAVPADIQAYRVALRAIATGKDTTSTVLPTEPTDYPPNT